MYLPDERDPFFRGRPRNAQEVELIAAAAAAGRLALVCGCGAVLVVRDRWRWEHGVVNHWRRGRRCPREPFAWRFKGSPAVLWWHPDRPNDVYLLRRPGAAAE